MQYRHTLAALLSATAVSGIMSMASAMAQEAAPAAEQSGTSAGARTGLEDIIVTARRTSENLQRVPVAASVLTAESLDRQQIRRATDLQFSAPSLVITPDPLGGSSAPVFQLRGQTSPLGADNTVVNYFADVPVDGRVIAAGIFDLSSVQVIRGPQGTLFGKNSTGGAVVFTPRKAETDDTNGYVTATIGNFDTRILTGAVNAPLIEGVLGVRVSGQVAHQDGMVKNLSGPDGNNKYYSAMRLAVTFTPSQAFENDLLVTYFNGEQRLNAPITKAIGGFANFFPNVVAAFARQQQLGNRTIDQSFTPNNDDNESYLIANTTSYDFGGVTLKNIFGYSNTHSNIRLNATSFQFPLIDVAQDRRLNQISNEVQLSGKSFGDSLNWIIGGFYSKQKSSVNQKSIIFSTAVTNRDTSFDRYTSKAVFGQATYDFTNLGLTGVKLTGGLRKTWDSRQGSNTNVPVPLRTKDSELSWTVGLDYQLSEALLLYVASRHSYKAGGFNLISPDIPPALRAYAPETLTDVELGVKANARLGDVPIRANLALYQGKYKNIHTQLTASCNNVAGLNSVIVNAGKGTPKGLELEVDVRPFPGLQVSGFYNRTLGKYDEFTVPAVAGCTTSAAQLALTGQNFGNISKNAAGLTGIYTLPLSDRGDEVALTGNLYYRSARLGNDLRGFQSPMPGYTLINLRLDYNNIGGSSVSAGAYVRNVTNKLYSLTRNNVISLAGYDTRVYGDPRTYGAEVTFKF